MLTKKFTGHTVCRLFLSSTQLELLPQILVQFAALFLKHPGRRFVQCFLFSRIIGQVTPKINYFYYLKKLFSGSKYPTNILFYFEKGSTADRIAVNHSTLLILFTPCRMFIVAFPGKYSGMLYKITMLRFAKLAWTFTNRHFLGSGCSDNYR